jgi:hypothetical protein
LDVFAGESVVVAAELLLQAAQYNPKSETNRMVPVICAEDSPVEISVAKNRMLRKVSWRLDKYNRLLDSALQVDLPLEEIAKAFISGLDGDKAYNRAVATRLWAILGCGLPRGQEVEFLKQKGLYSVLLGHFGIAAGAGEPAQKNEENLVARLGAGATDLLEVFCYRSFLSVPHYPPDEPTLKQGGAGGYVAWPIASREVPDFRRRLSNALLDRGDWLWKAGMSLNDATLTDRGHEYASWALDAMGDLKDPGLFNRAMVLKGLGLLCCGYPEQISVLRQTAREWFGEKGVFLPRLLSAAYAQTPEGRGHNPVMPVV